MTVVETVLSPCVSICRMSELTGLCEGCLRTIEEIAQWGNADEESRRVILSRIAQRRNMEPS